MPTRHRHLVYNLRPILLVRVIFGYYSDFGLSHQNQLILQFYCAVVPIIGVCLHYYWSVHLKLSLILVSCNFVQALVQYLISMYSKNNYVYEYYVTKYIIDGGEMYSKLKKIFLFIHVLMFIEVFLICTLECTLDDFTSFIVFPFASYCMLGRVPMILIFSLLYLRVKRFRKNIITTARHPMHVNNENNHVLAYFVLNDSLDKLGSSPMLQFCNQISGWFVNILWLAFDVSTYVKSENHEVNYGKAFLTSVLILLDTFLVFFPILMLELAAKELDQSKLFIVEHLMICIESNRCEFKQLHYFMRHQPLQYKLLNVVPITASLPLALIALGADYLVCALQFPSNFVNEPYQSNTTTRSLVGSEPAY